MSQRDVISYRPLLYSIAFQMVGCAATAEDMVQDTFFNWLKTEKIKVNDVKSYLTKSITNTCLNYLSSISKKKEELIDHMSNSISLPNVNIMPDLSNLDLKCEITHALGQVFKKLPPSERAVFVLKGVFSFDYPEVTSILGKTTENCRQLFSRAQIKLSEEKERFHLDSDHLKKVVADFKNATLGEFSELIDNLKKDIK